MNQHSGPVIGQRDDLTVIDCPACGFAHLDPLPDQTALDSFYTSDFWQSYKAGALAQFEIERPWWDTIHDDWLSLIVKHSTLFGNLLDVGCGYGYFMAAAYEIGLRPHGIEPSQHAVDNNKFQHTERIWRGSWESFKPINISPQGYSFASKYDVISALWLIEHLPDPREFLLWCYEHLAPDGVLLAAVPNDFSAIQMQANRVVDKRFYWLDKTHINYLTWSSFSNLLGRCGFRVVERTTLFPMEQYLLSGYDYTISDKTGKECHNDVRAHDLANPRDERVKYYQAMAREGRGREIVCVAVKE